MVATVAAGSAWYLIMYLSPERVTTWAAEKIVRTFSMSLRGARHAGGRDQPFVGQLPGHADLLGGDVDAAHGDREQRADAPVQACGLPIAISTPIAPTAPMAASITCSLM